MATLLKIPMRVLGQFYEYASSMSVLSLLLLLVATAAATVIFVCP